MATHPHPSTEPPPGPRPLALHLALQTLTWLSSRAALPALNAGSLPWRPELAAAGQSLSRDLASVSPEDFARALDAEAVSRLDDFAKGVLAYRRFPREPRMETPPAIWQDGSSRLLDYGMQHDVQHKAQHKKIGKGAPAILVVPSLVNKAYILDLAPGRSFVRALAERGFRPFLIDWGHPGADERAMTLTDYIAGRLEGALDAVLKINGGRPVGLVGYCMGGLLTLALAQRRPEDVAAQALLATPWDFSAIDGARIRMMQATAPGLRRLIAALGVMPIDALQGMFASLDPFGGAMKFRNFAHLDPASDLAREFVRLEDWLNDGVPLAGPVAAECMFGWFGENSTREGRWEIAGRPVRPQEVPMPSICFVPERDHIVPPGSAVPLAQDLPKGEMVSVPAGHIGMAAGSRAEGALYQPLADWFKAYLGAV